MVEQGCPLIVAHHRGPFASTSIHYSAIAGRRAMKICFDSAVPVLKQVETAHCTHLVPCSILHSKDTTNDSVLKACAVK